jgi:hydrogenase-4 component E
MQNVLSIFFCLSLFYLAVTSRVKAYVTVLQIQGIILTVLLVFPFVNHFSIFALVLPATLFFVKVILIPRYINKIILDLDIKRLIEPTIQQFNFLLLIIFSMTIIFIASNILSKSTDIEVIPFASGFSAIAVGIFIIIFRKKLIVHVAGFLVLENGIFLFGTAVASELPMMIEIGVLLDVFVVVFLMGIAINKISSTLSGFDVKALERLKD